MQDLSGIEAEVERLIKQGPPKKKVIEERIPDRCYICGGAKSGWISSGESFCRCDAARRKSMTILNELDPDISLTFSSFKPKTESQKRALALAKAIASHGEKGLAMFGRPGIGKSHLAIAICREVFDRREVFGYYNIVSLISRIQSSYSTDGYDSRTSIIDEVVRRQLVVLDDIGKEHRSPNVESITYELIDALYMRKRLLIICSNLPAEDYKERYDEAVRSRIAGLCEAIVVKGADMRRAS